MRIWLLIQNGTDNHPWTTIDGPLFEGMMKSRANMTSEPTALLIETNGGDAHVAFKIGRMFQRRCDQLTAIVPNYAKSAGTLLALSGSGIIFGKDAELGPLDVQMFEFEREEYSSALNAVQSLERMNAFSMNAIDQMVPLLKRRTGKKLDVLLPQVMDYMTKFLRPLLEKIDTVDFTKKSRELKVAEEYAIRLMMSNYSIEVAERIGRALVENYPAHEFVIDEDESTNFRTLKSRVYGLGLKSVPVTREAETALNLVATSIPRMNLIGCVTEMQQ
jgi:hypothetical protein